MEALLNKLLRHQARACCCNDCIGSKCAFCDKITPLVDTVNEIIALIGDVAEQPCECNVDNRCNACRALELTSKG